MPATPLPAPDFALPLRQTAVVGSLLELDGARPGPWDRVAIGAARTARGGHATAMRQEAPRGSR